MTESQFTQKLLKKLRAHPAMGGVAERVVKHANQYTKGVADFSVTFGERTTWWEVKRFGEQPTKIQQYYLDKVYGDGGDVITMSTDGRSAIVSKVSMAGFLSIDQLVEEIVARSLPFETWCEMYQKKGMGYVELVSAGKVKP